MANIDDIEMQIQVLIDNNSLEEVRVKFACSLGIAIQAVDLNLTKGQLISIMVRNKICEMIHWND